jgi:hypothetical protein
MDILQNPVNNFIIYEDDYPFEHLCQCIESGKIEEAMELTKTGILSLFLLSDDDLLIFFFDCLFLTS